MILKNLRYLTEVCRHGICGTGTTATGVLEMIYFVGRGVFYLTRPLMGDPISYSKLPELDNIVNSINYVTSPISLI